MDQQQQQVDSAKDMPLSVAFIRVFSVLMLLIGIAEFIVSGILMDKSSGEDIGGIYFAVTAVCSGFWGLYMVEGIQQFNLLTLFLFINFICSIVAVVYAGIAIYVVDRIKACAEFDPDGSQQPRCSDEAVSSFGNFTCSGNSDYFTEAAQCATRYVLKGTKSNENCGCTYIDGGTHCKEFGGFNDCEEMQNVLPSLAMGTYVLGYMCLSLSFVLIVCSCTASCFHKKKRGLFGLTAEELQQGGQSSNGRSLSFFAAPASGFRAATQGSPARGMRVMPVQQREMQQIPVQAAATVVNNGNSTPFAKVSTDTVASRDAERVR